MPRVVNRILSLRRHKASGRAYVQVDGRAHYLGKHGTREAAQAYERFVAEWLARDKRPAPVASGASVAEVIAAYMVHAIQYYRALTGEPTGEARNMADALGPVRRLYEATPAVEFGVRKLEAVRAVMVDSGLSREVVNSRVNRIRRAWRWAASQELVPAATVGELGMLAPLAKNRTTAPESRGVGPVSEDRMRAALPFMPAAVAAMVEFQFLTGCRVGEVLSMRAAEIDRSVEPWVYRPGRCKTDHHEDLRARMIPIGPKAAQVLEPFLAAAGEGFVFDPRESAGRRNVSQTYDRRSYRQAIVRACDRAPPHPELDAVPTSKRTEAQRRDLKAWRSRHRWSPLQLRHAAATRIRRLYGLEASQAVLGHAKMDVTQVYAERLDDLAKEIARATG
ncbi:tyrosine-type recombinase/integrase [Planctomyces sp. SH-PL62]|uniref:tyrosine-type recombinase/integrase n=1 Tax=Planctomyces sp. SH-PL62 TaxID=1636152 RepID=UPI00078E5696|nr:site-specific integrase [Planctomyces sp. SH-PL62]AMV36850.1 site-specific tyrosine recombinase XerD [Planctomyces sp. SH-PL62]